MREFRGRVAVVIGAANGIDKALAERFAAEGMVVVLADIKIKVSVLCPGGVHTPFMDFDRHRSQSSPTQGCDRPAEPQAWFDAWCKLLAAGSAPADIARQVLNALRKVLFYIIPHPELLPLVREGIDSILEQRNPVLSLPQELEMLVDEAHRHLAKTKAHEDGNPGMAESVVSCCRRRGVGWNPRKLTGACRQPPARFSNS